MKTGSEFMLKMMRNAFPAVMFALCAAPAGGEVQLLSGAADGQRAITIPASLGAVDGTNLFHQFRVFNIYSTLGESVTFTPPAGVVINNVITHVRGDPGLYPFNQNVRASVIDGRLVSTVPGANFFLINPQGIMFGPNAEVHVQGNFFASTADRLELTEADGSVVTFPDQVSMTSAEPSAFGFLGPTPASVSIAGSALSKTIGRLSLPAGAAMSVVGGDIAVGNGAPMGVPAQTALLEAPGGAVNLVSVAGAGTVPVTMTGADSVTAHGNITIDDNTVIDAQDVYIRGGRLVLEQSIVSPGITPRLLGGSAAPQDGGGVNVHVDADATLGGTSNLFGASFAKPGIYTFNTAAGGEVPSIHVDAGSLVVERTSAIRTERAGAGAAQGIGLDVGALELRGGGLVSSTNTKAGAGPAIRVTARSVEISGAGEPTGTTGIIVSNRLTGAPAGDVPSIDVAAAKSLAVSEGGVITSLRQGDGDAGFVTVQAGSFSVNSGAVVGSVNLFNGPGANVDVRAGKVRLIGDGGVRPTGLFAQARSVNAVGLLQPDSGTVRLEADQLEIRNGAEITADSFGFGRGGSIEIDVSGPVLLSRDGAGRGGIFAQSAIAGDAGSLKLSAGRLEMRDGFPISAITGGFGDAGQVSVDVAGDIVLSGENTGIFSRAQDVRQEDLDNLARQMRNDLVGFPTPFADFDALRAGFCRGCSLTQLLGVLGVNTDPGAGGPIQIAADDLTMNADTRIDASTVTDGAAGDLSVRLRGDLLVADGAQVRGRSGLTSGGVVTAGSGAGGDLDLRVAGRVQISGVSPTRPATPSAITSSALGSGPGGNIRLSGRELLINDGGGISASSEGTGFAGDITILTRDQVRLDGGSITTEAVVADGGDITILTRRLLDLFNSRITTSVRSGVGSGGNINIDPDFVVLQNSRIFANAFGGPGGNITIVAGQFIIDIDPAIAITASSQRSVNGIIDIDAPDTDVGASLAALPESFLDATSLLKSQCDAARGVGGGNSLVVAGRGGVPPEPGGYLPSLAVPVADAAGRAGAAASSFEVSIEGTGRVVLAHVGAGCA